MPSWAELRRGVTDLRALLAFRSSGLAAASRRRLRYAALVLLLLTGLIPVAASGVVVPLPTQEQGRTLAVLPSALLAFVVLTALAAVTAGGGREVVPRDQLVAYPSDPATEHLGALLLAPLNIGWLLQAWMLLGAGSYALGWRGIAPVVLVVGLWLVLGTALGQLAGWLVEGLRRGRRGRWAVRLGTVVLLSGFVGLATTGSLGPLLDHAPTALLLPVLFDGTAGHWWAFLAGCLPLVLLTLAVVYAGIPATRWALGRPERAEQRLESGRHPLRRDAGATLLALARVDRAAVWRSVPLRRGILVLAVLPGLVALLGRLDWQMSAILPGLVGSGGALLFGVNTWCLDGRGALWRESLPVGPEVAFWSRALVLFEVLVLDAGVTVALTAVGAGLPTGAEAVSMGCATVVVCVQVTGTALRWSVARPYAADMRSARATPAPPVVMAGYSARLALATTFSGLLYTATAQLGSWRLALLFALPMLCWSLVRMVRTADRWTRPEVRARVVATVAA